MQIINLGWHFADQPDIVDQQIVYFDTDQLTRRGDRNEQIGFYDPEMGSGFKIYHRTDSGVRGAIWDHDTFFLPGVGDVVVGLFYTDLSYDVLLDGDRGAIEQGIVQRGIIDKNQAQVRNSPDHVGRYRYAVFTLRNTLGDAYVYEWGHSERTTVVAPLASLMQIDVDGYTVGEYGSILRMTAGESRTLSIRFWRQSQHYNVSGSTLQFAAVKSLKTSGYDIAPIEGTLVDAEEGLYEVVIPASVTNIQQGDYVAGVKLVQGAEVFKSTFPLRITPSVL